MKHWISYTVTGPELGKCLNTLEESGYTVHEIVPVGGTFLNQAPESRLYTDATEKKMGTFIPFLVVVAHKPRRNPAPLPVHR